MSYLELDAIRVSQPLSDFFLVSIKAKHLLKISFSEELQYEDENGKMRGSQRKLDGNRLGEIGRYIDSVEMSFPSSIIVAANYNEEGQIVNDETKWIYNRISDNHYKVIIPTDTKLCAVIDGQHRLNGFKGDYITKPERLDVDLPVSIFFDLSNPYQAFLFATINGNQKKVDKSLALEQFGFNVSDEPQKSWTPEKLAVYFTRKLNLKESPLKGHIKIIPSIDDEIKVNIASMQKEWVISTATIVDGILSLISSNPKRDRVEMAQEPILKGRNRGQVKNFRDSTPLRNHYLNNEDDKIFNIVLDFFTAAKSTVLKDYLPTSYIFKTVGIQALFDLLKAILKRGQINDSKGFEALLKGAMDYDFSNRLLQASGIGRSDIRKILMYSSGLTLDGNYSESDLKLMKAIKKN